MAVTSLGTVTSALIATASPPAATMVATTSSACGALARWFTTTRYPCSASTNAVAAPIPRLAPVIRATRTIVLTSSIYIKQTLCPSRLSSTNCIRSAATVLRIGRALPVALRIQSSALDGPKTAFQQGILPFAPTGSVLVESELGSELPPNCELWLPTRRAGQKQVGGLQIVGSTTPRLLSVSPCWARH